MLGRRVSEGYQIDIDAQSSIILRADQIPNHCAGQIRPAGKAEVERTHTIIRAKLSFPRVTTVSSTRATPSIKAASSVILTIFTSIVMV